MIEVRAGSPEEDTMKTVTTAPKKPPAWFVHTAWRVHRMLYRLTRGRLLWTPANKRGWGAMRLTTVGRKSGQERSVIIGYLEDGANLVAIAMNGWDEGHPAWWLNLEARPDAVVRLSHQEPRVMRARAAAGDERERLWRRWLETDASLLAHAAGRSTETPVVVFEPLRSSGDRLAGEVGAEEGDAHHHQEGVGQGSQHLGRVADVHELPHDDPELHEREHDRRDGGGGAGHEDTVVVGRSVDHHVDQRDRHNGDPRNCEPLLS
jgi:deazaflavin-dependent oxidoreductase (nitroreductase family)